jgi:hypothetical membrane protein
MHPRALETLLAAAVAVPLTYFGAQAAAAPFFPEYSALTVSASDLGSDRSLRPEVLNVGAILTGFLALLGSVGLAVAVPRVSTAKVLSWLLAACVASIGFAAAWAGLHPLPSTQHDPGVLGAGMFAAPFASALLAVRVERFAALRWALCMNLLAFGLCAWVLSGAAGINLAQYGGLVQKLIAAVCFVPPAIIAFVTLRQLQRQQSAA